MNMDMSSSAMASMASATATMSSDMSSMMSAMSSMSMAMASSSMSMAMGATATAAEATATSTAMSGMDMGSSACKISMLWNWYTIDACFISSSWHITTRGMFAGTCLGVFAWILALEGLRRAHREFDRYVARTSAAETVSIHDTEKGSEGTGSFTIIRKALPPHLWHQAVRSLIYTIEFGSAYLLMLMAMYYNGYVMITMWISVFIAHFIFSTDTIGQGVTAGCC